VYEAIAGEVVNRRFVLLINIVLNGKVSAFNPLLHIHANRYGQANSKPYENHLGMRKGDIVLAINRENHPHPIVYLSSIDKARFHACILSSKSINGNLLMKPEHFCLYDDNNDEYDFKFNNTHLVITTSFIKLDFWIKDEKPIGRLSKTGVEFIENNMSNQFGLFNVPIWKI